MKYYFLLFLFCFGAFFTTAQTVSQFDVFAGRFDYLAIGNTLNPFENRPSFSCELLPESSATLMLEDDQTVVAAYLYWAGSGTGDFDVMLNGTPVSAERTFADEIDEDRPFFAAFSDITDLVATSGNIEYTFSGLDIDENVLANYCPTGTNFGGWSIVLVFEDMDLPLNQVNIFDGLESVSEFENELTIELENLNVLDNEGARIGFIAWEGDSGIAIDETMSINGNVLGNLPLNPFSNQFNGTNSFTNSDELFNMDIDVYNIENNINIGDDVAVIELTSGRDFVMINTIITVLNSQLPDAVINLDNTAQIACDSRDITIDYTVTNQGTEILPEGVPISFYGDGVFIETAILPVVLGIGESVGNSITITIGENIQDSFILQAIVDDPAMTVENNEENNESNEVLITLESLTVDPLEDILICDDISNDGVGIFNLLEVAENAVLDQGDVVFEFYTSMDDAENQINPISNPENYQNLGTQQTIYVRFSFLNGEVCVIIFSFEIVVSFQPEIAAIGSLRVCDDASNDGVENFDLSASEIDLLELIVLAGQDPADFSITFHNTLGGASANTGSIISATSVSLANGDSVFARIENNSNTDCFDTTEIMAIVDMTPIANPVVPQILCDDPSNDDVEDFDLTGLDLIILGDQNPVDFTVTFHNSQNDADTNIGAITSIAAVSQTNGSSLFARIENNNNLNCFDTTEIIFLVDTALIIDPVPDQIVCDDVSNDGIAVFDLSTLEIGIIGLQNPEDFVTTFYINEVDANASTNNLANITSVSLVNGDSVFARYQSQTFASCFGITEIRFIVNALPIINSVPDQMICDDLSNDGIASFNLSAQDEIIIDNQLDVFLSYHTTLEDAETGVNPISNLDNYTNTTNPQVIYTRLENELNRSCFDVGFFDIGVLFIEDVMVFESMQSCNEGVEMGIFDLTSNPDLEDTPFDLIVGYYTTLSDAGDAVNPISDPTAYQNISNLQEVYVRIEGDDALDCFEIGQFTLEIENCSPFVPEGFSPNGDGLNDVFEISRLKNVFDDYKLYIYSRLGNLIYEGDNNIDFWDGTPNKGIGGGEVAPSGVYYWVLQLNDPTEKDRVGWVYLNR